MSEKMSEHVRESDNNIHCNICNFKCCYESNYKQHLLTAKHKKRTNAAMSTSNTSKHVKNTAKNTAKCLSEFACECGKMYKHRQSLTNHKQVCNATECQPTTTVAEEVLENRNKESVIFALIAQNKELMGMLQEQSKTIQEITPRIGSTTTNNITNNNANTTNNNKFNLQVFLNEDCKDAINFTEFLESIHVTVEDLENQAQVGYVDGISKLFLENLKELGVNKRPIHCTDKKRNTLYIKENNEWDKEGSHDQLLYGIKVLNCRSHQKLRDMREENPEEYADMDSDLSLKCMNIQRSLLPVFPRETSFGKVIASISEGSIIDREPET